MVCQLCKMTHWIYPLYAEKKTQLHNLKETQSCVMCLHEACSQITSAYLDVALENRSSKVSRLGDYSMLIACLMTSDQFRASLRCDSYFVRIIIQNLSTGVSKRYALRRGVHHLSELRSFVYTSQVSRALEAYSNGAVVRFCLEPRK